MADAPTDSLGFTDPPVRPLIAGLLSLASGPTAYVYCGRTFRGLALSASSLVVNLAAAALLRYVPVDHLGLLMAFCLFSGFWLFMVIDVVRIARRAKDRPSGPLWGCLLMYVGINLAALSEGLLFRTYWAEAFFMPTRSMADTLLPGDRFLVDKLAGTLASPGRGSVVAFFGEGPGSERFVQRVIGLPGDRIEIRDEKVFRNGEPLAEPYAKFVGEKLPPQFNNADYGPETVPEGTLFLLGDHRRRSKDSRVMGFIPQSDVFGAVRVIYWSHVPTPRTDYQDPEATEPPGAVRWERIGRRVLP